MGELALHRKARQAEPRLAKPGGNAGLWWNKFCNAWRSNFIGLEEPLRESRGESGKLAWINTLAGSRLGDETLLREYADRRERLVKAMGGKTVTPDLQARFVAGTGIEHPVEAGMLFHHTLAVPFLPGAAVKGVTHAWAKWPGNDPESAATRIFGAPGENGRRGGAVGSVIFLDALPMSPVRLVAEVMTPHYSNWYQSDLAHIEQYPPADWYDPTPIPFLAVAENQRFAFAVIPNPHDAVTEEAARTDLPLALDWLTDALKWLGAGAKTAVGFGRFGAVRLPLPEPVSPAGGGRLVVGGRVVHDVSSSEGTLLGYEGAAALVDFGDGPEAVPPRELRPSP